ncbi:hypothetical protein MTO96_039846 [Rhipicephalus appendiculatus]
MLLTIKRTRLYLPDLRASLVETAIYSGIMKVLVVWALFVPAVHGLVMVPPDMAPMSDEMINFINSLNTTWKVSLIIFMAFLR